jgi:DNA-directed RNA polymerase subunit M/transcription elongation factor TFIIS
MSVLQFCDRCDTLIQHRVSDPSTGKLMAVCRNQRCNHRQEVHNYHFYTRSTKPDQILPPKETATDCTLVRVSGCYTCPQCLHSTVRLQTVANDMTLCAVCTKCQHVWITNEQQR